MHKYLRPSWIILFAILVLSPPLLAQKSEIGSGWQELKGTHFIIHYVGSKSGSEKVLRSAERYYDKIAKNLGYQRRSNFWLFGERCRIYVYPSQELYHKYQPQAPVWSGGFANYEKREIIGYLDSENFLETALPHEIAHLVLRDYLGENVKIPAWLDEGVALSQEELSRRHLEELVWKSFQDRSFIPIEELAKARVELAKHHAEVAQYYAQAALLVDYLMRNSRKNEFVEFCRGLRDGLEMDRALARGYNGRLKSLGHLEKAFLNDLASQFS